MLSVNVNALQFKDVGLNALKTGLLDQKRKTAR